MPSEWPAHICEGLCSEIYHKHHAQKGKQFVENTKKIRDPSERPRRETSHVEVLTEELCVTLVPREVLLRVLPLRSIFTNSKSVKW